MRCEIRVNGSTQIRLSGERPIEQQAVEDILTAMAKTQKPKLKAGEPGELVIELEHSGVNA